MKKALLVTFAVTVSLLASSMTAFAAPKTMSDGGIFDPVYYAQQNPGVAATVGNDENALYAHYKAYGAAEGRQPYDPSADLTELSLVRAPQTLGEKNALAAAKNYLSFTSFSKDRLTKQLESKYGSGFTHAEAVYAVANCGANWYEQAAKAAASYMSFSSFSKDRLIQQLESPYGSGFTHDQAVYGAASVGY